MESIPSSKEDRAHTYVSLYLFTDRLPDELRGRVKQAIETHSRCRFMGYEFVPFDRERVLVKQDLRDPKSVKEFLKLLGIQAMALDYLDLAHWFPVADATHQIGFGCHTPHGKTPIMLANTCTIPQGSTINELKVDAYLIEVASRDIKAAYDFLKKIKTGAKH